MFSRAITRIVTKNGCIGSIRAYCSDYTKTFLMPSAKRLVALHKVDASKLVGTGLGGRIMSYDVLSYLSGKSQVKKPIEKQVTNNIPFGDNYLEENVSEELKQYIRNTEQIKRTIPHSFMTNEICMDSILSTIRSIQCSAGISLSPLDIAVKAISNALQHQLHLNSIDVNISMKGIIFTIPNVHEKQLQDIHASITDTKASTSLTGICSVCVMEEDIVSSGGMLLSPSEMGAVTVGFPHKSVVVKEGTEEPTVKTVSKVNFSYNNVALDEAKSAAIMGEFCRYMELPEFMLE